MMTYRPNPELDASALEACGILDTPPEEEYENLTYLASFICGTPIALITLIDGERQWFKSVRGLGIPETPIEVSFCSHAVQTPDQVMMVPDAALDSRFADNPLVTEEPHIRLYAGAPIRLEDGAVVGTVCVIDHTARELNSFQIEALKRIASQASRILDFRRTVHRLSESRNDFLNIAASYAKMEEKYKSLLERHPVAIIQYEEESGEIVDVNAAAVELYGYSRPELFSMPISDLLGDLPSDSTLLTSARMIKHMRKDGSVISVHIQSTPLETDGRKLRVITVIDAGHQAEIAKSLTRVQEDFANAFETAPVSMALVATDDVISMVNDSFVRLVGYDREDVENSLLSSYIDEQDNERLRAKLATLVFGDAKSVRREVRIIRKDETKIRVLFSGTLVRDERGRPVHLIAQLLEVFEGPGALASASEI